MTAARYLPLTDIRRRPDARPIDETTVAALMDSIRESGLLCPIKVRIVDDQFELIAGSHRVAAYQRLGKTEILAIEGVEDDLHAELSMIDENLCRAELSPVDRAQQTARRKAIYEELHPEVRREATLMQGCTSPSRQLGETGKVERFTAETAARTGQSERTVQRDAERGEKVIEEAVDLIRGTKLDTGAYLDKLKQLSPNDQIATARRDLAHRERPRSAAVGNQGGNGARVKAAAAVAAPGTDQHQHLIRLLDEITAVTASDIVAACPARERAALASRLSLLIDRFTALLQEIAP